LAERFAEVDVNPLIVSAAGVVAVDARFVLVPETDDAG
jgi:succinyl-CoA synthetase beta subunit